MAPQNIVSIDCPKHLQHPGSTIAGQVLIDLDKAAEEHVEEWVVKQIGVVRSKVLVWNWITKTYVPYFGREDLHRDEKTIWTSSRSPTASGKVSLPFQFTWPNSSHFPPSFHTSGFHYSGTVRYYIKAVGIRSGMFRKNIGTTVNLPFLPFDNSALPPQVENLPSWKGLWKWHTNVEKMRRGLWGGYGRVETELSTPNINHFQLFRPIPIKIRVVTYSKPLPAYAASDESTNEFPIFTPSHSSLTLSLVRATQIMAPGAHMQHRRNIKPSDDEGRMIGGFGVKPGNDNWGREVTVDSSTKPTWVVLSEDGSKGEGRWKSETLFSTVVVFDEPPTWQTEYVSWEYFLKVVIAFPGVANNVKFITGPYSIVSSIKPRPNLPEYSGRAEQLPEYPALDLPPSYFELDGDDEDRDEKGGNGKDD